MDRRFAFLALCVLLFSLLVRVYDIDKPAYTWDEPSRYISSLSHWYNVARLDFSEQAWAVNVGHPPAGKMLYGLAYGAYFFSILGQSLLSMGYKEAVFAAFDLMNFVPARLVSALFGSLTCVLVFFIGSMLWDKRVGLASAFLLSTAPLFLAHTKIASLDSLLAFFFTLSVFCFFYVRQNKSRHWLLFLCCLPPLIKVSGFLAVLLVLLMYGLEVLRGNQDKRIEKNMLALPFVSAALFFLLWPWLWSNPVRKLLSLKSSVSTYAFTEYFLGTMQSGPLHYFITYFFANSTLVFLALFVLGLLFFFSTKRATKELDLLFWFVFPLLVITIMQSALRIDGVRYILMALPPAALLAGVSFDKLCTKFHKHSYVLVLALIVFSVIPLIQIHPYYLDYYNELAGGPKGVYGNRLFDIAWWGEGVGAAVEYLNANASDGSSAQFFVAPRHGMPDLRPDLVDLNPFTPHYITEITGEKTTTDMSKVQPTADYIVVNTYYMWYVDPNFEVKLANYQKEADVSVAGAPLVVIYQKGG